MQSWMFLGSYEKLRDKLLRNHTISSMAHLGTRAFGAIGGEVVSTTATMQSWMFLGSYEKLRDKLLRNHTISSMAHLGTRAFGAIGGEVVSTTATVFASKKYDVPGTYLRLVDMQSEEAKREGALEALANPNCGWF